MKMRPTKVEKECKVDASPLEETCFEIKFFT